MKIIHWQLLLKTLTIAQILLPIGAIAQTTTPRNLPPCPAIDYALKSDAARTASWHNCRGQYTLEFNEKFNGGILQGDWRNGKLHGIGSRQDIDGYHYVGMFKNGLPEGYGIYTLADGTSYQGELKAGQPHGKGSSVNGKGEKYTGSFKMGIYHGDGTFVFEDGKQYVGRFSEGNFHGQGVMTYPNGAKYSGQFVNNNKQGRGTQTEPDGRKFVGMWVDNQPILSQGKETKPHSNVQGAPSANVFMENLIGCPTIRNDCLNTGDYRRCMQLKAPSCSP